jgi:diguanylate cyclase (GGDEF)-like protein/PAS domain S-box-containing protein
MHGDPKQQARLDALAPLLQAKLDELKQSLAIDAELGGAAAVDFVRSHVGLNLMREIRTRIRDMASEEEAALAARRELAVASQRRTAAAVSGVVLLALLGGGLAWGAAAREVASRRRTASELQTLKEAAERAAEELFREKERAQVTLRSIGDGVITTDAAGRVEYLNPNAELMTGWSADTARGMPFTTVFRIIHQETREIAADPIGQALSTGLVTGLPDSTVLVRPDGSEVAVEDSAAPIRDSGGAMIGAVIVFRDVTEARRLAEQVSHQARHDPLTGLANRREFERRLDQAVAEARAGHARHTLLFLDLDRFKPVNDTGGHGAGDELLRLVAASLKRELRAGDTLARLGGDEFGALLAHCGEEGASRVADKLLQVVAGLRLAWDGRIHSVGVSIGAVTVDAATIGPAGPANAEGLMRAADAACYIAKEKGRHRVHHYRADDSELARRQGDADAATRVQRALREDLFELHAQPIVPSGGPDPGLHVEVLLRLADGEGTTPPMGFIPAAERYDLMPAIDRWVIANTLDLVARAAAAGTPLHTVAINLSGASFAEDDFLPFVTERIAASGVDPRLLCFEITETAAVASLERASAAMRELRALGCRFALDDFGSGMSSFAYLKDLPVDVLKIDGRFVRDIAKDRAGRAIVASITSIGHSMGLSTVAEFVENEEIADLLRTMEVDYLQGYLLGRPRPLAEMLFDAPAPLEMAS